MYERIMHIHRDLCPSEQKVFDHVWLQSEIEPGVLLSTNSITTATGLSHYTVFKYLKLLVKKGHLIPKETIVNKGTIYVVNLSTDITKSYEEMMRKIKLGEIKDELNAPRRKFVQEAREITKYLQREYARVLLENKKPVKAKQVMESCYFDSNQGYLEKHLRQNRDRTIDQFKRNIDIRVAESHWLTNRLGIFSVIFNFDRPKFTEKPKIILNFEE